MPAYRSQTTSERIVAMSRDSLNLEGRSHLSGMGLSNFDIGYINCWLGMTNHP